MKFTSAVCLLALVSPICGEELVRRRDLFSALEWEERSEGEAGFLRGPAWGYTERGSGTKGGKGMKGAKDVGTKYPYKPTKHPRPPRPPPKPDCKVDTCELLPSSADTCGLHTSCKPACVPSFCKLPSDPHKIHSWNNPADDRYVKLGSICGYMHFVEGEPYRPRHEIEVCCEVDELMRWEEEDLAKCVGCGACIYPQKVNDACCKIAFGMGHGRAGNYEPECDYGCCKCGPGNDKTSFVCLPSADAVCEQSLCPESTSTTASFEATSITTDTTVTEPTDGTAGPTKTDTTGPTDGTSEATSSVTLEQTTGGTDASTSSATTSTRGFVPVTTSSETRPVVTTADTTQAVTTPDATTADTTQAVTTPVATTADTTQTQISTTEQNIEGTGPGSGGTGLQASCFPPFDESAFNICLDLIPSSPGGNFEANWMQDVIDAAARWERVITGNLPSVEKPDNTSNPPPDLSRECSVIPVVDDLYVCAQTATIAGDDESAFNVSAFAGPYLSRSDAQGGLPYASRIGVNNNVVNNEGLVITMLHEFAHALGFPFLNADFGFVNASANLYNAPSEANDRWQEICGGGRIPMQAVTQGHWEETCLVHELMTPTRVIGATTPLSNITIGAMKDIGYEVDYGEADSFTVNDLNDANDNCVDQCPNLAQQGRVDGGGHKFGDDYSELVLPAEVQAMYMSEFRDDLMYFHEQLDAAGYFLKDGNAEFVALEQVILLLTDEQGHHHSMVVTYDDVKDMY